MLGAIAGDIIGSRFEFDRDFKSKDFDLFHDDCKFTDDTAMTCAVADWLVNEGDLAKYFLKWYVRCGRHRSYGGGFERWLNSYEQEPYNSFGNGAAMRVSPVSWFAQSEAELLDLAKQSAEITHNHPEGIKGAKATAHAIWLGRQGQGPDAIRGTIEAEYGYDLSESVESIREWYRFDATCQGTVPQALICALEATDFEDAIRNAISIGGDSDTVGAITGSVAEALFGGVPDGIAVRARSYLKQEMIELLDALILSDEVPLTGI